MNNNQQNLNPQQPQVNPMPPQPSKKLSNKIIAIIILAVVAGTVSWIVLSRQPKTDLSPIVINHKNRTDQNNSKNQDTAIKGWQTYKNDEIGLSLQYPNDWKSTINQKNALFNIYISLSKELSWTNSYEEVMSNSNSFSVGSIEMTPAAIINYKQEIDNNSNITIGGIKAIKEVESDRKFFPGFYSASIRFIFNNQLLKISESWYIGGVGEDKDFNQYNNRDEILQTFDKIISTINFDKIFTDNDSQNPALVVGDVNNWSTYSNEKYAFELKYPNQWNKPQVSESDKIFMIEFYSYGGKGASVQLIKDPEFYSIGDLARNIQTFKQKYQNIFLKAKEVLITNGQGYYYVDNTLPTSTPPFLEVYVIGKNGLYLLTAGIFPDTDLVGTEKILLQIASTFKFNN